MTAGKHPENPDLEQPLVSHLLELRDRILRMVLAVLVIFLGLFPFANDIYIHVAKPLMAHLPEGTSMIATEVASPFLTPFKLSLVASVFVAMPYILYQFWAFVAPGLYRHEKRLATPLVVSSVVLFYLGMAFAYYVVFPLVFAFLTGTAPEGVAVMTDIARYLDFVLTLFFAFGIAFEVPIATILLVSMEMTTPDKLAEKRPYIIVAAFVVGMFLTPPDVISQTLLALPMWILFELGVIFSRVFVPKREEQAVPADGPAVSATGPAGGSQQENTSRAKSKEASHEMREEVVGKDIAGGGSEDEDRFVPMTEEEMEAELDAIEAEEETPEAKTTDPMEEKLQAVQKLRNQEDIEGARTLLYEILEEGTADQRRVARNILAQLDRP